MNLSMKQRTATILVLLLLTISGFGQTNDEVLTNATIIKLYSKGLSPTIIISKIKTSKTNFDVSTDELIKLKEEKIPDDIVNAMVGSSVGKENEIGDVNDPMTNHESGIYYSKIKDDKPELLYIDPTVCTQSKIGSALGSALTYGIASVKTKGSIDGSTSRFQIEENQPSFYFYFQKTESDLGNTSAWNSESTSPNEFVLISLTQKTKNREFVTGKINSWSGSSFGFDEKQRVEFTYEKVKPGMYKVSPKRFMAKGEYCFVYSGGNRVLQGIGKVYDFTIK